MRHIIQQKIRFSKRFIQLVFLSFLCFGSIHSAKAQFSGTYLIGTGSECDYTTIEEAFNDLNAGTVAGEITYLLTDEVYNENPLVITQSGTASYPITIKPDIRVTPEINITITADDQSGILLDGADYIYIDGSNSMEDIKNTDINLLGGFIGNIIQLQNGATNNVIKNCKLSGYSNINSVGIVISGENNNENLIENNSIKKIYYGMYLYGNSANYSNGNTVISNKIGATLATDHTGACGIMCYYQKNLDISENEIFRVTMSSDNAHGIYLSDCHTTDIIRNNIHHIISTNAVNYGGKGIFINATATEPSINIVNNQIWHIAGAGSSDKANCPAGIYLQSTSTTANSIRIYFNSIYLTPDASYGLNTDNAFAAGISTDASSQVIDLRNNIIRSGLGELSANNTRGYAIYNHTGSSSFSIIDYNMYYVDGYDVNTVGYAGGDKDLAGWQIFTGQETNSHYTDPNYISTTDLRISTANNLGTPVAGVTDDYYFTSRDASTPDIGMQEQRDILYVKWDAAGTNTGESWTNAYTDLQTALEFAGQKTEIWVAQGTYKPSKDKTYANPANPRLKTFVLKNEVKIIGGFPGNPGEESSFDTRDVETYKTYLSGDLNNDNTTNDGDAFHILTTENVNHKTVVDGFYFKHGNANGVAADNKAGAALLIIGTGMGNKNLLKVENCFFNNNNATTNAGAISIDGRTGGLANPYISNCFFDQNTAKNGGAIMIDATFGRSEPIIISCGFENNSAEEQGGAISTKSGNGTCIMYCINTYFSNNSTTIGAKQGGAVYSNAAIGGNELQASYQNCLFIENSAEYGAGVYINGTGITSITFDNCTYYGNGDGTTLEGGGIYAAKASGNTDIVVDNSIFWNNTATSGSSYYVNTGAKIDINNCMLSESTCPFNGTGANCNAATIYDTDPLFVDQSGYDFSLKDISPAINAGDNTLLPVDMFDMDENLNFLEKLPVDIDFNERVNDCTIDLGVFENQSGIGADYMEVSNGNDTGTGSLREAITHVCDGGLIEFTDDINVVLASPLPPVSKDITISGNYYEAVVDANGTGGIFTFNNCEVLLEQLTLKGGNTAYGAAVLLDGGNMDISQSALIENHATSQGGAVYLANGNLTVENTTISGNSSESHGGGINQSGSGLVSVLSGTIAYNTTNSGDGGGIKINSGTFEMKNSILALNVDGDNNSAPDIQNTGTIVSQGNNIIGINDATTGFTEGLPNGMNDWIGNSSSPVDPHIRPLDYYGGNTPSHTLKCGSIAIDAGVNFTGMPAFDQRAFGFPRTVNGTVDIGAVEAAGMLPLSGDYTIDASQATFARNYQTFNDAIDDLTCRGMSGSVNFDVAPFVYDEQISIPTISGASSVYTVTFHATSGTPTLQNAPTANNWVIRLYGSKYITISGLCIQNYSSQANIGTVIQFDDAASTVENITITNNTLIGRDIDDANFLYAVIDYTTSNSGKLQNIVIKDNDIQYGSISCKLSGSASLACTGVLISKNSYSGFYKQGLFATNIDQFNIYENQFTGKNTNNSIQAGIQLIACELGLQVQKNRIVLNGTNENTGIQNNLSNGTGAIPLIIANNTISILSGSGDQYGISLQSCAQNNIFHNSVLITSGSESSYALTLQPASGDGLQVANNILANTGGGCAIYTNSTNTSDLAICNFNLLYSAGPVLVATSSNTHSDLGDWHTTAYGTNSISEKPPFIAEDDLHINPIKATGLNDAGTTVAIYEDVDGETRNATSPDIGADEGDFNQTMQPPGYALDFDGTDDCVVFAEHTPFDITGDMTLEVWIKPRFSTNTKTIVSKKAFGANENGYALFINSIATSDGRIIFRTNGATVLTAPVIQWNQWQHIAVVISGGLCTIYVNGIAAELEQNTLNMTVSSEQFTIGALQSGNLSCFDGYIDELRLWSTARTQIDIQDNMNQTVTDDATGLIAYYRFNQQTGSILYDISDNMLHGLWNGNSAGGYTAPQWGDSEAFNVWIGGTSGSEGIWNENNNWSDGIPTTSDNVAIPNVTHQPVINAAAQVHHIAICQNADLTINAANTFQISGNYFHNGALFPNQSTVEFNGSEIQYLDGNPYFYNMLVSNTSALTSVTVDATPCHSVAVAELLQVSSGHYQSASDYHHVEINATMSLSSTVTVSGNWTNNGTFTHNGHGVIFDGTTNQCFEGSATTAFYSFEIDKTSGMASVNNNIQIDNELILTNGCIRLQNGDMILAETASISGNYSTNTMIIPLGARVIQEINTNSTYFYPVGDNVAPNQVYSPIQFTFTGSTTFGASAQFDLRLSDTKHSQNASTSHYLKRHWIINQSEISDMKCDVTASYHSTDVVGTETEMYSCIWNGTSWSYFNPGAANQLTATVTEFGDFTAGEYTPPPCITSFSPVEGAVGQTITIYGENFEPSAADNTVFFGAVQASVTSATPTTLTVTVPMHATLEPITVTARNLTAYSYQPFIVTFNAPPIHANYFKRYNFGISPSYPKGVEMADVDKDGKPDILIADFSFIGKLAVLRNTSTPENPSFATKETFNVGKFPQRLAFGDLDGDGLPDVVVSNRDDDAISVLRNTSTPGNVSFAAAQSFPVGDNPVGIAIGDLDMNGKPDVVVANKSTDNSITIYRNTSAMGSISFAARHDETVGSNPYDVKIADIDKDAVPDIVIANSNASSISFLRNQSTLNNLSFTKIDKNLDWYPKYMSIADFDRDGTIDLAYGQNANTNIVRNTSSPGNISFDGYISYTTGTNPNEIASGDLDGNGQPDIASVAIFSDEIAVLQNRSSAGALIASSFSKHQMLDFNKPDGIDICDVDGDTRADIIVSDRNDYEMVVLWNDPRPQPVISSSESPVASTQPFPVTVEFGIAVSGFTSNDISISNGIISDLTNLSNGSYQFNVSPISNGIILIDIAEHTATDAYSLAFTNYPAAQFSITYETIENALYFDGIDDHIELPANALLINQMTIEQWIKPEENGILVYNTNSANENGYGNNGANILEIHTSLFGNKAHFILQDGDYNTQKVELTGNKTLNFGEWYHIAVSVNASGMASLYVNGELDTEQDISGITFSGNVPIYNYIGKPEFDWRFYKGILDEVRIWSTPLTQEQIRDVMCRQIDETYINDSVSGLNWTDLHLYYQMNQGDACNDNTLITDVADNSGNSYNGVLYSFNLISGCTSNWTKSNALQPIPVFSSSYKLPTGYAPVPVTIDFNEKVRDFESTEINISSGNISDFESCTNGIYSFQLIPPAYGTVLLDVSQNIASDYYWNGNMPSSVFTIEYVSPYIVTNTNNDGAGSIRWCIDNANAAAPGTVTITFDIPVSDPNYIAGEWVIKPNTNLPAITKTTVIDATTQPGWTSNTIPVVIDGANSLSKGIEIYDAPDCEIYGLQIKSFNGIGVYIWSDGADNFKLGTAGKENAILNSVNAIWINGADNGCIQGNRIGMLPSGTGTLSNANGIVVGSNADNNMIGGTTFGEGNIISGNQTGISLSLVNNTTIQGNFIGTNTNESSSMPNDTGIEYTSGTSNNIGGVLVNQKNIIANNNNYGIHINGISADQAFFRGNSIYCNGTGILIDNNGNNNQVAPAIHYATTNGVVGTAPQNNTIDVYANENTTCPDENQGKIYLGTTTADANGNWRLPLNNLTLGYRITATATDPANGTSEFSPVAEVQDLPPVAGFGHHLEFDGVDDQMLVPDNPVLRPDNGSFTISFWTKLDDVDQTTVLLEKYSDIAPATEQYGVWVNGADFGLPLAGRKIVVNYVENWGVTARSCYTNRDIIDGEWHHIAVVADKAADRIRIYVDGIEEEVSHDNVGGWPTIDNTDELRIFGDEAFADPTLHFSKGAIDELRIWKKARTADKIRTDMYRTLKNPETQTDLSAYWRFDESMGSYTVDASSNSNSSDIIGAAWITPGPPIRIVTKKDYVVDNELSAYSFSSASLNYEIVLPAGIGTVNLPDAVNPDYTYVRNVYASDEFSYRVNSGGVYSSIYTVNITPVLDFGGTISTSTTWIADEVHLWNDVSVSNGITLTIEPDTKIIAKDYYGFYMQGALKAIGTPALSIAFTPQSATSGWRGFRYTNTSNGNAISEFDYCSFAAGKANTGGEGDYGGAFYLDNYSGVSITNCAFRNNNASKGGAIYCINNSSPVIKNTGFESNNASDIGGALSFENSSSIIQNCKFIQNQSNYGGAIHCNQSSNATIVNSVFSENTASVEGGAIYSLTSSTPTIVNSTISRNIGTSGGGGLFCSGSSPVVLNTILWGNTSGNGAQVYLTGVSNPDFTNCDIQAGLGGFYIDGGPYTGNYINNIDNDPLFVDATSNNYSLQSYSPCINSGKSNTSDVWFPTGASAVKIDIEGNPRYYNGNIIDIGACEYQGSPNQAPIAGFGHALSFDGSDDYLQIAASTTLIPSGGVDFTIALWVKPNTTGTDRSLLYKNHSGNGTVEVKLGLDPTNKVFCGLNDYNEDGWSGLTSETAIPIGEWTNICVTKNGNKLRIFLNGLYDAESIIGASQLTTSTSTGIMEIGGHPGEYFNGSIDEIHLWNIAVNSTQIRNNLYKTLNPSSTNLMGYWHLDENTGVVTLDATTTNSSNDATIHGANWTSPGAPVLMVTKKDYTWTGKLSAYDAENNTINSYQVVTPPSGTLTVDAATGDCSYSRNFYGNDTFTYRVSTSDGKQSGIYTVNIVPTLEFKGEIDVSETWIADYVDILDDVSITNGKELTIEPDTKITMQKHCGFYIQGAMKAIGTPMLSITFAPETVAIGWQGFRFINTNPANTISEFNNCSFTGGIANTGGEGDYGGAFYLDNYSGVSITNCTFLNNNASKGGAIYCINNSSPVIKNTGFESNNASDIGGALSFENSSSIIQNCEFIQNQSNYGGAIHCNQSSNATIVNSVFSENTAAMEGGAIYSLTNSTPTIVNCTISRNTSLSKGGGIVCSGSSPIVLNTILWGNITPGDGKQVYLTGMSDPDFIHCNIEGGLSDFYVDGLYSGAYVNNIDANPLFVDAASNNYSFQRYSPCINTGKNSTSGIWFPTNAFALTIDIAGEARYYNGGVIDIGAYEAQFTPDLCGISITYDAVLANNIYVSCEAVVLPGATLTIQPGTNLFFKTGTTPYFYSSIDYGMLKVQGKLVAIGTEDNEITFTRDGASGNWGLVVFDNTASVSTLSYTNFEHANLVNDYHSGTQDIFGAVTVYKSTVDISHSSFSDCSKGIYSYDGSASIASSTCINSGIYIDNSSPSIIDGCYFENQLTAIQCDNSDVKIYNNILSNNGKAITLNSTTNNAEITNNTIVNQTDYAVYSQSNATTLKNNIIWNNNTLFGASCENFSISNCILQPEVWPATVVDAGGNFSSDPQLASNYYPTNISPAINSGITGFNLSVFSIDFAGNPRLFNDYIDIGAIEYPSYPEFCGAITTDLTFPRGTVAITCEVTVNPGVTLNIFPYTSVEFKTGADFDYSGGIDVGMLRVQGTLSTHGTETDPVLFTRHGISGNWGTILFDNTAAINTLQHCKFQYANRILNIGGIGNADGAVSDYNSNTVIEYCYFENNYDGIFSTSSSPVIQNNTLINNAMNGISHTNNSFGTIYKNLITNNKNGIYCSASEPEISNNRISGNTSALPSDGRGIKVDNCNAEIINNIIHNNDVGITCNNNAMPTILNNTIADNNTYGVECVSNSNANIVNTIIWNSGTSIYTNTSNPVVFFSNVEGGYTGTNILNEDPLFIDATSNDYSIQSNSPCINSGDYNISLLFFPTISGIPVDYAGSEREKFCQIDIGAYEALNYSFPGQDVIWYGCVSNDWHTGGNWSTGMKPTNAQTVYIPGNTEFQPNISGSNGECKTITINANQGAVITIQTGIELQINP